jgi:hypothetical protein
MKVAIMQPYLFPYIGYFQLINFVDKFIVYDDVNYIKSGWINRNNLLINHNANMFTVPLKDASSNKLINEIIIADKERWKNKFLKTIDVGYRKAPYQEHVFSLLEECFALYPSKISEFNILTITAICNYLDIKTKMIPTSELYGNKDLAGPQRVLDICQRENATHYINPIGGLEMYRHEMFSDKKIKLNFIKSRQIKYDQFGRDFVPWLSILDVIMFNSKEETKNLLTQFDLV